MINLITNKEANQRIRVDRMIKLRSFKVKKMNKLTQMRFKVKIQTLE